VSVQPTGAAEQSAPSGATYTLSFADGRMSARVDCNVCNGAYSVTGQTLTTSGPGMACTLAFCPTTPYGNVYTGVLAGESTIAIAGSALTLTSSRGVLRFRR
jgi:heat shock protein HslJ